MKNRIIPFLLGALLVCCVGATRNSPGKYSEDGGNTWKDVPPLVLVKDPLPDWSKIDFSKAVTGSVYSNMVIWKPDDTALRDQFAMSAMNGILSHNASYYISNPSVLASQSYGIANNMMEARNKN